MDRYAEVTRKTGETDIVVKLDLDGSGVCDISTGVPFFDHMLNAFGRHGLFDLTVRAVGDVEVDAHHTVEDTGIVLGEAFCQALSDKVGITRFADAAIAMDETLVMAAVDISGRGQAYCELPVPTERVGSFDTELAVEFFYAFARDAKLTLHVRELAGGNSHHIIEAAFKAALAFIDHNDKPEDTGGKPPPRVMDWEQDESIMFPAVNKVAGFEVRTARYVHWWTFMGYYMEISDGVFAQVLNLRLKRAKGKKLEKSELEFARENARLIKIRAPESAEDKAEKERLLELLGP